MKNCPHLLSFFSVMLVLIGLNACSSSPRHLQYYALKPAAAAPEMTASLNGRIGIGPVQLPESQIGDGVLVLAAGQRVKISADHIWAGDLKLGISRSLAQTLSQTQNNANITAYPWDSRLKPERQVFINIEQLAGELNGVVSLSVQWSVYDNKKKIVQSSLRKTYALAPRQRNYPDYVADINHLILQFAVDLAQSLVP